MTRFEFIDMCIDMGVPYVDETDKVGMEMVYAFSRKEYEEKRKHPRKNKNLYVPYLRVSHFDETLYKRYNGLTGYTNEREVKDILKEFAG